MSLSKPGLIVGMILLMGGLIYASVAAMWPATFAIASFFAVIAPISVGVMMTNSFGIRIPTASAEFAGTPFHTKEPQLV